jgi:hypothetical protein
MQIHVTYKGYLSGLRNKKYPACPIGTRQVDPMREEYIAGSLDDHFSRNTVVPLHNVPWWKYKNCLAQVLRVNDVSQFPHQSGRSSHEENDCPSI